MIVTAGEAIMDFTPCQWGSEWGFLPRPGGSLLNVAISLARLGIPTGFLGRLSTDVFGRQLYQYLQENQVDLTYVQQGHEPTALAFVNLREAGVPEYAFYGDQTADSHLKHGEILPLDERVCALHCGSIALVRGPGAVVYQELMQAYANQCFLSLDPNIRPAFIPDREAYRHQLRQWIQSVDLVKVSQEDLQWLFPGGSIQEIARSWVQLGAGMVVVTLGSQGAVAFMDEHEIRVGTESIQVVDTVGAGDAFMSGLLAFLYQQDLLRKPLADLSLSLIEKSLTFANKVAGLTCQQAGSNPPWASELNTFRL